MTEEPTAKWDLFGDFSRWAIVDRVGKNTKGTVPHFDGPYPEGSSGLYKWWRFERPNSGGTA